MVAFPVLRRAVVAACALMVIPLFAAGSARASDIAGGFTFDYWVEGPALVDGHRWVVAGSKLPSGACRYSYESLGEATEVGWAIRSVAVDMSHCAKLFEDGFPTHPGTPQRRIN